MISCLSYSLGFYTYNSNAYKMVSGYIYLKWVILKESEKVYITDMLGA